MNPRRILSATRPVLGSICVFVCLMSLPQRAEAQAPSPAANAGAPQQPVLPEPLDRRLLEHIPPKHEQERSAVQALLDLQDKENRPNALLYYTAAGFVQPGPPDPAQSGMISSVVKNGWTEQAEPLRPYLASWEPALTLVRQGATLGYANGIDRDGLATVSPNVAIQTATNLLCVNGRRLESQGKPREALGEYLAALGVGRDYESLHTTLIHQLTAVAITARAAGMVRALVASGSLDSAGLELCRTNLEVADKSFTHIAQGMRGESVSGLKRSIARIRKDGNADALIAETQAAIRASQIPNSDKMEADAVESLRQLAKDPDRAEADNQAMWDFLIQSAETPWWQRPPEARDRQGRDRQVVDMLKGKTPAVAKSVPNMLESDVRWLVAKTGLRLARVATGLEIAKKAHAKYPPSLDALTAAQVGDEPVIDPFSGKPLLYRLDGDRYALWSVGPDSKDDAGALVYDPTNGTTSAGDVVVQR